MEGHPEPELCEPDMRPRMNAGAASHHNVSLKRTEATDIRGFSLE
jgi:hypothetical protein